MNTGRTWFKKGYTPWNRKFKLSENEFKKIYLDENLSIRDIAQKLKIGSSTVHRWLKRFNIKKENYLTEILHKKISDSLKGKPKTQKHKLKLSEQHKGKHTSQATEIKKGQHLSPQTEFGKTHKLWNDPKFREKITKNALKGLFKRPTTIERKFIEFIQKYNLPYKYTGNGSFLIDYRNPDFININGEKVCIEVREKKICQFRSHEDPMKYEMKQINHYKKYGWRCIVLFSNSNRFEDSEDIMLKKIGV